MDIKRTYQRQRSHSHVTIQPYRHGSTAIAVPDGFALVVDTREQKPLFSPPVIPWTGGLSIGHRALKHGDYSVHGFMDQIVAERKQMSDLLAYIGKDRDRTIKKLDAMQRFFFKAFLIEADDALDLPDYTQLQESHVLGFLKCLRVKYGFHILISRDRQELERFVLEHFIYAVKLLRQV